MGEIMKKAKILLYIFLVCLLSSCAVNKKVETPRTITVKGKGTVYTLPDRATVVFSVMTQNRIAHQAVHENTEIMGKVIEAIKNFGIRDTDISTSDYSVEQQGTWNNNGTYTLGRYVAGNTITVIVRNIDTVGNVIDIAVEAGANSLNSLVFSNTETETATKQARNLAVQDAQNAAALFAGASGCSVGEVLSLVEESNFTYSNVYRDVTTESGSDTATPISAGRIAVTSNITVTYKLQ